MLINGIKAKRFGDPKTFSFSIKIFTFMHRGRLNKILVEKNCGVSNSGAFHNNRW